MDDVFGIAAANGIWWALILAVGKTMLSIKAELMARSLISERLWHGVLVLIVVGLVWFQPHYSDMQTSLYKEHKISLETWVFWGLVILFIGSQGAVHLARKRRLVSKA